MGNFCNCGATHITEMILLKKVRIIDIYTFDDRGETVIWKVGLDGIEFLNEKITKEKKGGKKVGEKHIHYELTGREKTRVPEKVTTIRFCLELDEKKTMVENVSYFEVVTSTGKSIRGGEMDGENEKDFTVKGKHFVDFTADKEYPKTPKESLQNLATRLWDISRGA